MTEDAHDLIGAYAMSALSADEAAAFERHLQTCETCRDELVDLREGMADLAGIHEVEPPPALRDAVLAAVANLEAAKALSSDSVSDGAPSANVPDTVPTGSKDSAPPRIEASQSSPLAGETAPVPDDASESVATVTQLPRRSAGRAGRSRWQVLVAAAVALIAVFSVAVWQPWAPHTITAADVLAAPDAVRATGTVNGASVTVVRSNQLGRAVLVTRALPDAPSGKVRQAWIQSPDDVMVSGGLMPSGGDVTMLLEGDARDSKGAGISLEPAGGSPKPSVVWGVVGL